MAKTPGITARHSRTCASRNKKNCNCEPSYEAWVWSKRDEKKIRQTFSGKGALSAAKAWRSDSTRAVRLKQLRAPTTKTLSEYVDEWFAKAERGEIRSKGGKRPYKPAVLRNYRLALNKRVLPDFGDWRLSDIEPRDLLELKGRLHATGHSDSTVRNSFVPLQAVYRHARREGFVTISPVADLELPVAGRRERAAKPTEAAALIEALPEDDRALWATAFYAGLRRGELRALRVIDVNETCIHVEYGWDDKEGQQSPKSLAGRRDVPLTETLRGHLRAHLERNKRAGEDLVFGRTAREPFTPGHISDRADEAWAAAAVGAFLRREPLGFDRLTLHEARHSFSTWVDHAGVSPDRADRYMGHSSGSVASHYRHLLPAQLVKDAETLEAFLAGAGAAAGKVVALGATG